MCFSDNKVCQQMCGLGKQCIKEIMLFFIIFVIIIVIIVLLFVFDECESLEDGVCYQFCLGGSCVLECFNLIYYIIYVFNFVVVRILFYLICKFC